MRRSFLAEAHLPLSHVVVRAEQRVIVGEEVVILRVGVGGVGG